MTNNNSATALTDLAGFPMVLAVSEDEINRKFAEIYGNASNGPETFPHMPWKALKGKGWELDVDAVSAPHIDFKTNTKNGCVLRMTIQSGQFTTFKMVMPDTDGMPDPADIKVVPTTIPLDGSAHADGSPHKWDDGRSDAERAAADALRARATPTA